MTLPATIDSGLSWSDSKSGMHGPFEFDRSGTKELFVFLVDNTNSTVEAWRSTDGGNTWAEQDSANHPAISSTAGRKSVNAVQIASNGVRIYSPLGADGGEIQNSLFNLNTLAWGSGGGTGSGINCRNNVAGVAPIAPAPVDAAAEPDRVVLHQGGTQTVMGTAYRRVVYSYRVHTTTSWTTNVDVAGTGVQVNYDARAAISEQGSTTRAHLFWTDTTNTTLKHRTVTLGAPPTLETIQNIDTTVNVGNYSVGIPIMNGTTITVPYVDSNGDLREATATTAQNPSWSTAAVATTNGPEYTNANPGALALNGSTLHRFWPDDSTQDIWRNSSIDGTETEWKDAITCNGISIGMITGGIGVLYDDGGTIKYDLLSISAPTISRLALLGVG